MSVIPAQTEPEKSVRVLIVDDSALVRRLLTEMLDSDPGIEVLGSASDAFAARKKIKELNPDVITLDIEMPGMDGLQFLRNLMRLRPLPVVMVSSLTERGADVTLQALALGAVDYVCKPKLDLANTLSQYAEEIVAKVKVASSARVRQVSLGKAVKSPASSAAVTDAESSEPANQLIAIGASTGGTEAVREVLEGLPVNCPGIVLVQHISKAFSSQFVHRLDQTVPVRVVEASEGEVIKRGCAYVAPGDRHLEVVRTESAYCCHLHDGEPLNFHRPAVDVLFRSVAKAAGENAVGVILTGMGNDGANGLSEMRRAGARTIAQDQRTSVVWGMPSAAIKRNAVVAVVPLGEVAEKISAFVSAPQLGDK